MIGKCHLVSDSNNRQGQLCHDSMIRDRHDLSGPFCTINSVMPSGRGIRRDHAHCLPPKRGQLTHPAVVCLAMQLPVALERHNGLQLAHAGQNNRKSYITAMYTVTYVIMYTATYIIFAELQHSTAWDE